VCVVKGVPNSIVTARPAGAPHSIAEELWHIVYWQDLFLRRAQREPLPYPDRATLGWQKLDTISQPEWEQLVARFDDGLARACGIAGLAGLEDQYSTLTEPRSDTGPLTLQELLTNLAVHNAYHLGRIVLLRQMLGNWPPPGGGDTW
jgi:uncharacterized damage-inducible protein DinB